MSDKTPTIQRRLQRAYIVMSSDAEILAALRAATPAGWEMKAVTDLEDVGEWQEILLHRFILVDLDEVDVFDPLAPIREVRTEYMLQTPILCFGGDEVVRDQARLARADRFFEREEIVRRLPEFLEQFGWGG